MRIKEFDNYAEACDYLRENELDSAVVKVGDEHTLLKPTGQYKFVSFDAKGNMVIEELEKVKAKKDDEPKRSKGKKIKNPKMPTMGQKEKRMDMQDVEIRDDELDIEDEGVQEVETEAPVDSPEENGSKDGRGRKKGSGKKDKMVLQALQKFGEASSKQLADETGVSQVYVSIILKNSAKVARKEGRTIIYTV